MSFDKSLWDDSDPDYAPLTNWSRHYLYWRPSKKYRDLGFDPKPVRLPGVKGDALGRERAALARKLTRDMLNSFGVQEDKIDPGTWAWVIYRYRTDPFSAYNDNIKSNTRDGYDFLLDRWKAAIGHMKISAMTYEAIKHTEMAMRQKGRSASYIKRMFGMLRTLARYGTAIDAAGAGKVATVLSTLTFKAGQKRATTMTPEQVRKIIDEADRRGLHGFALGVLIQWTYALRAVDVRGQWLASNEQGGISRDGKRWQDGLTWDMFDPDLTVFEKVISKTAKSMPYAMRYELTPEIRSRVALLSNAGRFGPVITSERNGQPYTQSGWTQAFSRIRKAVGVPQDVWLMDARSGALTDARNHGADAMALRDLGVHAHVDTTSGYVRERSESINRVVKLRSGK
jgi:site-specific recombinase XerD